MDRSEEIRKRYASHDPLNLSAVQREAPHLLEGIWDPEHFIGWRRTVEAAGVPIDSIRVFPNIEVICPLCGWFAARLLGHLGPAHGMTIAEIRKTFPDAEEVCEELRGARMGIKKNRKALTLGPHWEPAWSRWYALDRLRWFYDQGVPVNYISVANGEPGLAAYLRRVMGSWSGALRAIGLDPEAIRINKETQTYSRQEIVTQLRCMARKDPAGLSLEHARNGHRVTFFRACLRQFKSYEAALTEAKLDPLKIIPALTDPVKTAKRATLLSLAVERIKNRPPYQAAEIAAFLKEWSSTVFDFYGSWVSLSDVLGVDERDIFNPPSWTLYTAAPAIVAALKERAELGLSLREGELRTDNSPLVLAMKRVFGTMEAALTSAGLKRPPRSLHLRKFTPETLLAALQERHQQGKTMNSYKIAEERTDALLMKWATRFFGSWLKALDAAGVPAVVRSKPVRKIPLAPVPLEKYLNQIRARAAAGLSLRIKDMHGRICEGGNIGLTAVCRKRFGSWKKALEAAGISVIPDATKRRSYRTVKAVIAELRRRHEASFSLQPTALLRGPNCDRTLLKAIGKLYPDYSAALEAAGLPLPPSIEPAKPLHSKTQENQ